MAELIRLYLDEDVSVLVGEMLRARGVSVLTTRDASNLGADDEAQLRFATISERTFLTHNRADFERLAVKTFETESTHSGIIIATRRQPREITLRMLVAINGLSQTDMINQIRYI